MMLAGERGRLREAMLAVFRAHGVEHLYERVVVPALVQVGELWSRGEISVADEHLATATLQTAITSIYPLYPWPERGPRIVVACADGERHGIGARLVADLLALDGWDDLYLGAGVPPAALAAMVVERDVAAAALSATVPAALPALRRSIEAIRAAAPAVRILVGGRAVATLPDAAATLGADAFAASASEAVEVCRAWR
jgi:MerR family transcriptional regulator, light-induced transcriptional regulator